MVKVGFTYAILVASSLGLTAADLTQFSREADRLSKEIKLSYYDSVPKLKSKSYPIVNYQDLQFESKGKTVCLHIEHINHLDSEALIKLGVGEDCLQHSYSIKIGDTTIFDERRYILSKASRLYLEDLRIRVNPNTNSREVDPRKVNEFKKEIERINHGLRREKTIFGGAASLVWKLQDYQGDHNKDIVFTYKKFDIKAMNPPVEMMGGKGLRQGFGDPHQSLRGQVRNIYDLAALGLVDSTDMKFARIIYKGVPFDGIWPAQLDPEGMAGKVLRTGQVFPGLNGATSSIVVGKHRLTFDFEPVYATTKDGRYLQTAMINHVDKNLLLVADNKEHHAQPPLYLPAGSSESSLPLAGMDSEGRVFSVAWGVAMQEIGIFILVQYGDEPGPRMVFLDSSGIAYRIQDGSVEVGFKSKSVINRLNEVEYEEIYMGPSKHVTVSKPGVDFTKAEYRFGKIGLSSTFRSRVIDFYGSDQDYTHQKHVFSLPRAIN